MYGYWDWEKYLSTFTVMLYQNNWSLFAIKAIWNGILIRIHAFIRCYMFDPIRLYFSLKLRIPMRAVTRNHNRVMRGIVVVILMPCTLASMCVSWDLCHYPDTKPLGASFLDIPTKHVYPASCAGACAQTDGCVGVTLGLQEEMCHLYNESDTSGITQDPGTTLWLIQATGVPCVMVSAIAI